MKIISKVLVVVFLFSFIAVIINLCNFNSKRSWKKTDAVVTSVLLPEGNICGDFTDNNGVMHTNEQLLSDFRFQQIRAIKKVSQEKIDNYIGTKITIIYNPDDKGKIESFDKMIKSLIDSISVFVISIVLYLIIRKKCKRADTEQ